VQQDEDVIDIIDHPSKEILAYVLEKYIEDNNTHGIEKLFQNRKLKYEDLDDTMILALELL